jgi:iron complex outermembrane recepter protein
MVRRFSTRWVLCALAAWICACPSARAAQPSLPSSDLKSLSLEDLGNIEVTTASKEPAEVWQTPDAIYVLTQDDIRRSGATSVPDALRLVPGVNVERVSGDRNWVVAIRGLGDQYSKYVQVLIDGRSVYTPLFGGVFWTIDNVMLEDVDRIEVIRGPGGTIWGDDAVNGIINIITKSAGDTQGTLLSAGGGSVDQGTAAARYGGLSHGVNFRVYGFGFARSPEYHQGGQPNYDWSRLGQAGMRSDWKHGRDEVTVQGDAYLGKLGDAQVIPSFVPAANSISYASTNTAGGNILGRWRRDLGPNGDLYLQAYWSIDRRLGPNFGEMRNTFDIDFLHRTPPTEHQQFTYGAGMRVTPSTIQQTNQTLGFTPLGKTDSTFTGFVQEEIHILPGKLSLTAGTKLEHNSYTGFEYQPNGRLLWTPTPTTTIWLAASRAVRIPDRFVDDLNDYVLPVTTPLIYALVVGNPTLRAERLVSYELGYRALIHRRFYMDFAAFHNQYHDLIAQGPLALPTGPAPPQFPAGAFLLQLQYQNGIRGNTDGGEVGPDWQPTSWWQLKAAYSYLHVHLGYQPAFNDPMNVTLTTLHGSSPNSQAVLRSMINLPHKFELDQTIRFVGALPAQQVKAYVTGDLRAGYHDSRGFDLSVVGENLFQPHHGEFGITPGPNVLIKRSVYAKLVWTR